MTYLRAVTERAVKAAPSTAITGLNGLHLQPRCRVCRNDGVRRTVNDLLANGASYAYIVRALSEDNAKLDTRDRITIDSVRNHTARHFPVQQTARATYREVLERRARENAVDFVEGVATAITPLAFLETVVVRAYETLVDEDTAVSVDQGVVAARELGKLTAKDDDERRWAAIHATQNKIIATFKEVVPAQYHQAILDKLEGGQPVPTGRQLALVEGGRGDDGDAFDPLDGDGDDFDED